MRFHVAAYSLHPSSTSFDAHQEAAFLDGLRSLPSIAGIELPHLRGFDRWDEEFFFRHADPAWTYVATGLPGLSQAQRGNPDIGLSAADETARRAAVDQLGVLRDDLRRTHDRLGRRAIQSVEIHTGCRGGRLAGRATPGHLADSLAEIGGWAWDGAELLLEHCDAAIPGRAFQKGFLTVEEEIAAIRAANARLQQPIGAVLNWGRSAIEGRSRGTPTEHVAQLRAAGLLRGLFVSGCGDAEGPYGAWQDTHMPPAATSYAPNLPPDSLLTEAALACFFAQAGDAKLAFLGVKVAIQPPDATVEQRLALLRDTLTLAARAAPRGGSRLGVRSA